MENSTISREINFSIHFIGGIKRTEKTADEVHEPHFGLELFRGGGRAGQVLDWRQVQAVHVVLEPVPHARRTGAAASVGDRRQQHERGPEESQQCVATTKAGARCRLRTTRGQVCWVHLKHKRGLRVKKSGVAGLGLYTTKRRKKKADEWDSDASESEEDELGILAVSVCKQKSKVVQN